MARISLDGYRKQWPRVGGVLAMALGGAITLAARRMPRPQLLSAVNFGALLVHQYEEYEDPGWFPGQFNHGVLKSDRIAGDKYSPGFLASFFLHVPIGVSYIRALNADDGLTRSDIVKGAAYTVAFAVIAVAGPNIVGSNRSNPHAFTPAQMGHHDVQPA